MGLWGLWAIGHMGYKGYAMGDRGMGPTGAQGVWGTRGMGNGSHWGTGVWGIWAMSPTGGISCIRSMGHINRDTGSNKGYGPRRQLHGGVQGYGPHGQWGPWAICFQNIKKMSSCQKDVKLS